MSKGGRPFKVSDELNQLRFLIENDEIENLKIVLKSFGIDAHDENKRTALIWASFFNNIDLLKWLIENNANLDQQDKIGYSALHFCAQEKNIEAAKILIENGANSNIKDIHDNSPLWTTILNSKENFEMLKLLLENGASPDEKNLHGRSPNDISRSLYEKEIKDVINS